MAGRTVLWWTVAAAAMAGCYDLGRRFPLSGDGGRPPPLPPPLPAAVPVPPAPALRQRDAGPTIEQVRRLASLVVTRVDVADVSTTEIAGFTGGVRAALVVRGDLAIAVDLGKARFESQDPEKRSAVLVLPPPEVSRPRLDQEKTRVFELTRQGLWSVVPGDAGQSAAVNHAYRHAQQVVAAVGAEPRLIEKARRDAEETLAAFFHALGWSVAVRWEPG